MNSEGFAFARWSMLMKEKHQWGAVHGWDCSDCRDEWISLQIMAVAPKITAE